MTGAEAMAKAGIATLDTLVSKEGLGTVSYTHLCSDAGSQSSSGFWPSAGMIFNPRLLLS